MAVRVWQNFVVSVWLLLGYCAWQLLWLGRHFQTVDQAYGPFAGRVVGWPLALGGMELLLWLFAYRRTDAGARIMAGFMGVMLLLRPVLVAPIVSDLYERPMAWGPWWLYLYVAVSHLAFSAVGRR